MFVKAAIPVRSVIFRLLTSIFPLKLVASVIEISLFWLVLITVFASKAALKLASGRITISWIVKPPQIVAAL